MFQHIQFCIGAGEILFKELRVPFPKILPHSPQELRRTGGNSDGSGGQFRSPSWDFQIVQEGINVKKIDFGYSQERVLADIRDIVHKIARDDVEVMSYQKARSLFKKLCHS